MNKFKFFLFLLITFLGYSNFVNADFKESNNISFNTIETSSNQGDISKLIDRKSSFNFDDTDTQRMIRLNFKRSELDGIYIESIYNIISLEVFDGLKKVEEKNGICKDSNIAHIQYCNLKGILGNELVISLNKKENYYNGNITSIQLKGRYSLKEKDYNNIDLFLENFYSKIKNKTSEEKIKILLEISNKLTKAKNISMKINTKKILDYVLESINNKLIGENETYEGLKKVREIFNEY